MADTDLVRKTTVSKFYRAWVNMKSRCYNQNVPEYHRYGGRGIQVCNKWHQFDGFIEDMYDSYDESLTLDRIDNNLGYSPENCRWVDRTTQARNTRNIERAKKLTHKGVTKTIREWAEEYGMKRRTLSARVFNGWSTEEALNGKETI